MTDRLDVSSTTSDSPTEEIARGRLAAAPLSSHGPSETPAGSDPPEPSLRPESHAAPAATASRPDEDLASLVGDEEPEPVLGFYLVLGTMVAALLLVVFWYTGSRRPAAQPPPIVLLHPPPGRLLPRLPPAGRTPMPRVELRPALRYGNSEASPPRRETPTSNSSSGSRSSPTGTGSQPFVPSPAGGPMADSRSHVLNRVPTSPSPSLRLHNDALQLPASPLLAPVSPDSLTPSAQPGARGETRPPSSSTPLLPEGRLAPSAQAPLLGGPGLAGSIGRQAK
jgi:hypothetical protein